MTTAADVLVDTLAAWGVEVAFGMPGDSIDPIMEALRRDKRIRFVLVRHEEAGALAASAYAKLTGKLAACLGTSGPGSVHLLNGLMDASLDHAPVVAVTGQVDSHLLGTDYFQEVDLTAVLGHACVWSKLAVQPDEVGLLTATACRTALARHGPAHLSVPFDIGRAPVSPDTAPAKPHPRALTAMPTAEDLDEAASLLNRAERPVILAGRGGYGARAELARVAEMLQAPVVHTLPAKGVLPEDHPLSMGGLGLLGGAPAHRAMERTDALLMVGTSYPYLEFLPAKAQTVQIDADPAQIGKRHAVTVPLVGTAQPTLKALADRLTRAQPRDFVAALERERDAWWARRDKEAARTDTPLHPQVVAQEVGEVFDRRATFVCDVGNILVWMAHHLRVTDGRFLTSAWLGTMGFGVPGAIGAALARPEAPVVAVCGDGGFAMQQADLVTAVRYNLPVTIVVLVNDKLAMIKYEQEVAGYPEWEVDLVNPDFARLAEAAGAQGITVRTFDAVRPALEKARDSGRPTVVACHVRANEMPMPPRIAPGQAMHYALALFRETFE